MAHRQHPTLAGVTPGSAGKKRSGMTVRTQPKQDKVEARYLHAKETLQFLLIFPGGKRGGSFALNAVNVLLRDGNMLQQGFVHHAIIAIRVAWRHTAFITPEEMHPIPNDTGRGKTNIQFQWGGAACQCQGEAVRSAQ